MAAALLQHATCMQTATLVQTVGALSTDMQFQVGVGCNSGGAQGQGPETQTAAALLECSISKARSDTLELYWA